MFSRPFWRFSPASPAARKAFPAVRAGHSLLCISLLAGVLAACNAGTGQEVAAVPTATLAPIVSQTPRLTATPVPSLTERPSQTFTPTETPVPPTPSNTFTPSPTPPVLGSVASASDVNIREGPDVTFAAIEALRPGTEILILGISGDARWLNIRMDGGDEGWISAALVRIQPSATPIPSLTPTLDRTAQALGTAYPTSIIGGQPVSPTPPRAVVSLTPGDLLTEAAAAATGVQLPDLGQIEQTATALVNLGVPILTTREPTAERPLGGPTGGPAAITPSNAQLDATRTAALLPTSIVSGGAPGGTQEAAPGGASAGDTSVQNAATVPALCDQFGGRPRNLAAGSTIRVFWRWYAATAAQVDDHADAVDYDVRVDGVRLENWRQYGGQTQQAADGDNAGQFFRGWAVPFPTPLTAGQHTITYRATWSRPINDGTADYGPGTANVQETGSCTFTVGE